MTTYLGKSCSFCLPRVPFVNCRQFMYLVISLLVLRAGYGIWLYQFLIIAYLFTFDFAILPTRTARPKGGSLRRDNFACFGRHNSETCVCITTGKNGERLDFSFLYGNWVIKDVICWLIFRNTNCFFFFFVFFLHVIGGLNDIKILDSYNDLLITLILNTND